MTHNILDIYDRLYAASDNIKGQSIDYNLGFQDAVYTLKIALQKYEHINLHVVNRKLSRELFLAQLALDDKYEDRDMLKLQIDENKKQIQLLERRLKEKDNKVVKIKPHLPPQEFTKCQLEINNYIAEFWVNTTQDQIDVHMPEIGQYIATRLGKTRRQGKPAHLTDYKVWCMEVLRHKGIKCLAK